MNRVIVTMPMLPASKMGIMAVCFMQVCAEKDVEEEEILEVCNRENPSGTENGWTKAYVEEITTESGMTIPGPGQCKEYPDRQHILVSC